MSFSSVCCVLSSRGFCDGKITPPEESYRLLCLTECNREASAKGGPWPTRGFRAVEKLNGKYNFISSDRSHYCKFLSLRLTQ